MLQASASQQGWVTGANHGNDVTDVGTLSLEGVACSHKAANAAGQKCMAANLSKLLVASGAVVGLCVSKPAFRCLPLKVDCQAVTKVALVSLWL